MRKTVPALFVVLCLVVCLVPSVGMVLRPTNEPIGNEHMVEFPSLVTEDGAFNTGFLPGVGQYFENHFAFRPEAITADAMIQANAFGVSNTDTVVAGSGGWLYYSSTLDDYLGENALSPHQVQGVARNLDIIRRFAESNGADFLFAVAPNKNTLYPEHMPYYYREAANGDVERNRDALSQALADGDVNYCDLFALFEGANDVLYHARDSHWTNEGALLAYDAMLTAIGKAHDDFAAAQAERRQDFTGDLAKMIYPAAPGTEYNTYYGAEERYEYTTDTASVEDPLIKTASAHATGSLYMYRDSFGNALLPFFASAYGSAVFTKSFPMMLENDLAAYHPDDVVFEIAERNIGWFVTNPPVITAPRAEGIGSVDKSGQVIDVTAGVSKWSPFYIQVKGGFDSSALFDADGVYVSIVDSSGKTVVYECYDYMDDQGEDGFLAYLKAADYPEGSQITVSVIISDDSKLTGIGSNTVIVGGRNES